MPLDPSLVSGGERLGGAKCTLLPQFRNTEQAQAAQLNTNSQSISKRSVQMQKVPVAGRQAMIQAKHVQPDRPGSATAR